MQRLECQIKYSNTRNLSAARSIGQICRHTGIPTKCLNIGVFICAVRTGNAVVIVEVNKLVRLS